MTTNLYYVAIIRSNPTPVHEICKDVDASKFGWLAKGAVAEGFTATAKVLVPRLEVGRRDSFFKDGYCFHMDHRREGICGVLASKEEYPTLAGLEAIRRATDQFLEEHPKSSWQSGEPTLTAPRVEGQTVLKKYDDPQHASKILQIQNELDETVAHAGKALESLMQRGEKLDDLLEKSNDLSSSSKMFYQSAKKQNSCCVLM